MKIKIVRSNTKIEGAASFPDTQKVVDMLESSENFEDYVYSTRKYLSLPENGASYSHPNREKFEEQVNDINMFSWIDKSNNEKMDFNDYCIEITDNLGLPIYWSESIYNFILYNIFFTPVEDKIDFYPAELWMYVGEEKRYHGVEIVIKEQLSRNEIHNLIDRHWSKLNSYLSELNVPKKHKMFRMELAKRIIEMKDVEKKTFKTIADFLEPESLNTDLEGKISEDYVKGLYHRGKKVVLKLKKS